MSPDVSIKARVDAALAAQQHDIAVLCTGIFRLLVIWPSQAIIWLLTALACFIIVFAPQGMRRGGLYALSWISLGTSCFMSPQDPRRQKARIMWEIARDHSETANTCMMMILAVLKSGEVGE